MKEDLKHSLAALAVAAVGITAEGGVIAHPGKHTEIMDIDPDELIIADDGETKKVDYTHDPDVLVMDGNNSEDEPDEERFSETDDEDVEDHPTLDPKFLKKEKRKLTVVDRRIKETQDSLLKYGYGSEDRAEKYFRDKIDHVSREKFISLVTKKVNEVNESLPPNLRITPSMFLGLIAVESNFKTKLTSKAGARGLCQFIPASAERVGVRVRDRNGHLSDAVMEDPATNIEAGVKILVRFIKHFGSVEFGVVAYNSGDVNLLRKIVEVCEFKKLDIKKDKGKRVDMNKIRGLIKTGKITLRDLLEFYLKNEKENFKKMRSLYHPAKTKRMEEVVKKVWSQDIERLAL